MKIRPLILDDVSLAAIRAIVTYAEENRLPFIELHRLKSQGDKAEPLGNDPQRRVVVPMGYRCAFTIEQQPDSRLGWVRHLSISVDEAGKLPNEFAIRALMEAFGMGKNRKADYAYMEDLGDDHKAVNVLTKIEEEPKPHG